jgi:zinc protease
LASAEADLFQESNFEKDYFYISWPVEGFKEDASVAYELLALVLGQGESSYLYKDLKLEKGLCRSIGASYFSSPDDGIFVISGVCSPEEKEALFAEIPKTLESFFSQEDLTEEIKKAQNIFSSEQSYSEESISSQCRLIGDDWLYYDAFGATEERRKKALLLDSMDINDCSRRLLDSKPYLALLSSTRLKNSKEFLKRLESLKDRAPSFKADKLEPLPVDDLKKSKKERYASWTTEKGSKVHLLENYETEVISFKMTGLGGELLLTDEEQGLSTLFGSLWARETKEKTESQMTHLFDTYCSSFSAFSGKHSFGLSMRSLSYLFDILKSVVPEVLNESVFSESLLKRDIQSKLYMIKAQKDRPSSVAFKVFNEMLFKDSFYSRDPLGLESYYEKVSVSDLEKHLKDQLSQKRTYTVVGAIEESKVKDFIDEIEEQADFSNHKNLLENREFIFKPEGGFKELPSDKAQAHIILGYPGFDYKDKRKVHLKLLEAVFGGQGGRLFIELRDKASLAYSVAPVSQSAYFGGFFSGYIACDPSKKDKAIKMMRDEFNKFVENKMTEDELNWAKNQVLGQELMSLQRNSTIADQIVFDSLYGLDPLAYQSIEDKVKAISAEELSETMKTILSKPEFLVTVG